MYGMSGPINTILNGKSIVAPTCFQATGESVMRNDSPFGGKRLASVPKRAFETNKKANPAIRNKMTNFVRDMFIFS